MIERRIKNFEELAETKQKEDALEIVETAYNAIDTKNAIKEKIKIENDTLFINKQTFNLNHYEKIYLIGFGKVACEAAEALEKIFEDKIEKGVVIGIKESKCNKIETHAGTHPMPSEENFEASQKIADIGNIATEKDLVIAIIGGGGSSLLCFSQDEKDQGQKLYESFLTSGGDIKELNIVRRHLSELKGGGLAKYLFPATVIGLIFSDIPGDDFSTVASGPTYKDPSTIEDAQKIINKYNLGEFKLIETPKEDKYFEKIINIPLVSNHDALNAMEEKAANLGYSPVELSCCIYDFPKNIANLFQKHSASNTVVMMGGETKLIIPKECNGKGGRNSELALEMLDHIKEKQIFVSFASDGHDNGDAAGVIIDFKTKEKVKELGINIEEHKVCLDSYPVFEKTKNLIFTGDIEANVSDLTFLLTFN